MVDLTETKRENKIQRRLPALLRIKRFISVLTSLLLLHAYLSQQYLVFFGDAVQLRSFRHLLACPRGEIRITLVGLETHR